MKIFKCLLPCLMIFIVTLPIANAISTIATVDKIRYCRSSVLCNSKLQPDYHWWEDNKVSNAKQKNTYLSRYNQPSRSSVRHLVFLSAGQRFGNGIDNLITGQPDKFHDHWIKTDARRTFNINTNSIAYRIFDENIYSESNTFVGLAFDARFNHKFTEDNKREIVNAYYDWLKSKVYTNNLESVYLAGHSRGGSLVMRLAKKFQNDFPNVAVIVHNVDGVANKGANELGTYGSKIDNPNAGSSYWAWKTNLRTQFSNKKHLSIRSFTSGERVLDFLNIGLDVRAFSLDTAYDDPTDLGWYHQTWETLSHVNLSRSQSIVNQAISHLRDRLNMFRNNMAPAARASASSTYCSGSGLHCYSPNRVNDRDLDSRVGGYYSWTNSNTSSLPQWVKLTWPATIKTDRIDIITSENFVIQDYHIQYLNNGNWETLLSKSGNNKIHIQHSFNQIRTRAIRLVGSQGASNQPQYIRLNEILVRGDWVTPPNKSPVARCSASPAFGFGSVHSNLSAANSYDSDGNIIKYQWRFSDGGSATGKNVYRTFYGADGRIVKHNARLTVTDNKGATNSISCTITVAPDCHQLLSQPENRKMIEEIDPKLIPECPFEPR